MLFNQTFFWFYILVMKKNGIVDYSWKKLNTGLIHQYVHFHFKKIEVQGGKATYLRSPNSWNLTLGCVAWFVGQASFPTWQFYASESFCGKQSEATCTRPWESHWTSVFPPIKWAHIHPTGSWWGLWDYIKLMPSTWKGPRVCNLLLSFLPFQISSHKIQLP